MGSVFDGDDTLAGVLWVLSSLGAVAWLPWHFMDLNLVTEVASVAGGSSGLIAAALYGVIGVAGALALADNLGAYDITDVTDEVFG